jgi:hypothetical protein
MMWSGMLLMLPLFLIGVRLLALPGAVAQTDRSGADASMAKRQHHAKCKTIPRAAGAGKPRWLRLSPYF